MRFPPLQLANIVVINTSHKISTKFRVCIKLYLSNLNYFVSKIVFGFANIMKMLITANEKPVILVAPLNWGLGHASRCIPIIYELLHNKCEVIIACGESQKALLQGEFRSLRFIELAGYDLKYAKKRWLTFLKIIFQIPKILIQIKSENRWLQKFLSHERINAVISDNRYGFYSRAVLSVFITHQLNIRTPFGERIGRTIQRINYSYINHFSLCWIPDLAGDLSLAGELSNPGKMLRTPARYIGYLTRFKKREKTLTNNSLLVILSGPEPQRTVLEKILLQQLHSYGTGVTMVRGLPAVKDIITAPPQVKIYNHIESSQLNDLLCETEFIICRSGYSSIMDIIRMGKKSILIPTPGQPEQEYLAAYLLERKLAYSMPQKEFVLNDALLKASQFQYVQFENPDGNLLEPAVGELLSIIRAK
jgi:hypothetical protein